MATNTTGYNNVVGLLKHFPDEAACALHLEALRWPDGKIVCQVCGSSRKGISSHQLAREIGVTQKTAWFVLGRLRKAAEQASDEAGTLPGPVEADESYFGGKNKNRHADNMCPRSRAS